MKAIAAAIVGVLVGLAGGYVIWNDSGAASTRDAEAFLHKRFPYVHNVCVEGTSDRTFECEEGDRVLVLRASKDGKSFAITGKR